MKDLLPVYVVSVKKFTDRHLMIRRQATQFGLSIEFIWDFDVETMTPDDRARCDQNVLPLKSMSCVLKHIEAQKRLLATEHDICLVLEDDAILGAEFDRKLQNTLALAGKLEGPWLIFLGGMDNALDARFFANQGPSLIESPLSTAEAYLINREGCFERLAWLSDNLISKPADHFLAYLDTMLSIPHYRVSLPFVTQGSITGLFPTSLDSSRSNKPAWYLALRYGWNRLRKQKLPIWFSRIRAQFVRILNK